MAVRKGFAGDILVDSRNGERAENDYQKRRLRRTYIIPGLNAGQFVLVGNSFVSFVRAFDFIFELTVFRRHAE